jgi:hypothetical protein
MTTLTQAQVDAYRLKAHHLDQPAPRKKMHNVVNQLGGVHAQVMSSAELALCNRVKGIAPADVRKALWEDRSLVKSWGMRGTLHLFSAQDFPTVVAALSTRRGHTTPGWLKYFEVTLEEMEALIEAVRTALDGQCLTRQELAAEVARITGTPRFREFVTGSWGSFLKPAAFKGYLCFGPSRGQAVTFVRPDQWLGGWREEDPGQAVKEMVRRYLSAYGPASRDNIALWWGGGAPLGEMRVALEAMRGEIEEVRIDGSKAYALASTLPELREQEVSSTVRLLGLFDPYTVAAWSARNPLTKEQKAKVSRTAGWISSVVLVGGRIAGVWDYRKARSRLNVTVEMFEPATKKVKESIEAEAARYGDLMDAPADVTFA